MIRGYFVYSRIFYFIMAYITTIIIKIFPIIRVLMAILICVAGMPSISLASSRSDSLLKVLDSEIISNAGRIDNKKKYISELRERLNSAGDRKTRLLLYDEIYREYRNFQYDSAYSYARQMLDVAREVPVDTTYINKGLMSLMECYNSVGLFKEASDMLHKIDRNAIPSDRIFEFYNLCLKYYRNMSSYVGADTQLGRSYIDSMANFNRKIIDITSKDSYNHAMALVTEHELTGESLEQLVTEYEAIMGNFKLDDHTRAVMHSWAGRIYRDIGDIEKAKEHLAQSAIYDLRSCTRETTAAKDLAQLLHSEGDLDRANRYIHLALDDAEAYNSRLRRMEINGVLPYIEKSRYSRLSTWFAYLAGGAGIVLALLGLSLWLFFKLRQRNRSLAESQAEIKMKTSELQDSHASLMELNKSLMETAEIKDQYIVQTLIGNTGFVDYVESCIQRLFAKLKLRQYDEVAKILRNIRTKEERNRMYTSFDSAFLRLFPNFPDEFNALFPAEDRIEMNEETGLPSEVRIFALMRLGIDNTAEVAKYLNLSVNTVYVYKTKLKSKSIVNKDDFEIRVMQIPKP